MPKTTAPALTAAEWWRRAREQWKAEPPARHWRDVEAFAQLTRAEQRRVEDRIKAGLRSDDPLVREFALRVAEDITVAMLEADEPAPARMSEHMRLEVAASAWIGRPLEPGQPVPGCGCEKCTGVAPRAKPLRLPRDLTPALDIDRARELDIRDVARLLGLEHKRGWARCPFHSDSKPSLHLNSRKRKAFCNPCGKAWDALGLTMALRNCSFPEAVRWLLNLPEPERRIA